VIDREIAPESEKFLTLLNVPKIDEKEAVASLDKLLDLERRRKRSELLHLFRVKNALDEKQQALLAEIRHQRASKSVQLHAR